MADHTRTILLVSGMRDSRCRERIAAALEAVPGVKEVELNLYRARAVIVHEARCAPMELVLTVERAGYGAAVRGTGGHRAGLRPQCRPAPEGSSKI